MEPPRNRLLPLGSAVVTVLGAGICVCVQGALSAGIPPPLDLSRLLAAAADAAGPTL